MPFFGPPTSDYVDEVGPPASRVIRSRAGKLPIELVFIERADARMKRGSQRRVPDLMR